MKSKYTILDLKSDDINFLAQVCHSPEGTLNCLGRHYFKLRGLNLICGENKITKDGREFLQDLYDLREGKKKNALYRQKS